MAYIVKLKPNCTCGRYINRLRLFLHLVGFVGGLRRVEHLVGDLGMGGEGEMNRRDCRGEEEAVDCG